LIKSIALQNNRFAQHAWDGSRQRLLISALFACSTSTTEATPLIAMLEDRARTTECVGGGGCAPLFPVLLFHLAILFFFLIIPSASQWWKQM
jgi:hypothetical protein